MTSAAEIAAQLTEGLDDSLQPLDDKAIVTEDDDKKGTDDDSSDDSDRKEEDADKGTDSDKGDDTEDKESKDDNDKDDEGYTIDEIEVDKPDDKVDVVEPPVVSDGLSAEQKYIVDNLTPLKVRGYVGDGEELQEFTIFDPLQLPSGFKYVDDRERGVADKALKNMDDRARQLQNDFRSQESLKAQKAFKEAEEKADWEDIARLQKEGDLPKFKLKPDDKDFDNDPTSVLIDKVMEYKDKLNADYLEAYNKGRPFRQIGFEDAYGKYLKANPVTKKSPEEAKEDKDRKDLAKRTSGTNGDKAKSDSKPIFLPNKREIDNYIDSLEF